MVLKTVFDVFSEPGVVTIRLGLGLKDIDVVEPILAHDRLAEPKLATCAIRQESALPSFAKATEGILRLVDGRLPYWMACHPKLATCEASRERRMVEMGGFEPPAC